MSVASVFPVYSSLHGDICSHQLPFEFSQAFLSLERSMGFHSQRRYNLHALSDGSVLFSSGNTVQILDINAGKIRGLFGHGRGAFASVGALAVHPSRKFFAVAERGDRPAIFIYCFPSLDVVKILRDGGDFGFSSISFSPDGSQIASVASEPDYSLTVWDWAGERVILRTRAFSADVSRVEFSPHHEGRLLTSGSGHIKFWRMAATFTGLKLQGAIGKFGAVELSDIHAFVELPDGRVLSGSDSGFLLMWDGNFIQYRLSLTGRKPCHQGSIEHLAIFPASRELLTAGSDGFIKRWPMEKFEFAEAGEGDDPCIEIQPISAIRVEAAGRAVRIRSLTSDEAGNFLLQDFDGGIFRLDQKTHEIENLLTSHSGAITNMEILDQTIAITCGLDSTVRLWDYSSGCELLCRRFHCSVTALLVVGPGEFLAGFADGAVRIFNVSAKELVFRSSFKPHNAPIHFLGRSPDGSSLFTADSSGSLFFFEFRDSRDSECVAECAGKFLAPLGFAVFPSALEFPQFHSDSSRLLASCGSDVLEVSIPRPEEIPKAQIRETFKLEAPQCRRFSFKFSSDVEEGKIKISSLVYAQDGENFLLSVAPAQLPRPGHSLPHRFERIYQGNFSGDCKSFIALGLGSGAPAMMKILKQNNGTPLIAIGFHSGLLQIRPLDAPELRFSVRLMGSRVSAVSLTPGGGKFLAASDEGILQLVNFDLPAARDSLDLSLFERLEQEKKQKEEEKARLEEEKIQREKDSSQKEKDKEKEKEASEAAAVSALLIEDSPEANEEFDHWAVPLPHSAEFSMSAAKPTKEGREASGSVDSIDSFLDPRSYSIEEAKQKAEADDRRTAAERTRDLLRLEVSELRKEFQALRQKNSALDRGNALENEEFKLEPPIEEFFELETQRALEEVAKELQWTTEKHAIALKKLRAKFLDPLIVEQITIQAIRSKHRVASFRVAQFPQALRVAIENVHRAIDQEEADKAALQNQAAQIANRNKNEEEKHAGEAPGVSAPIGSRVRSSLSEAEIRRAARAARQVELSALKANKPERGHDDPEDVAAVAWAQKNMGDFKLKSDPHYLVPENQRVNAERKRRQLLLLQESVQILKMALNERFLALRDLKARIVRNIQRDNGRLRDLNEKLGDAPDFLLFQPEFDSAEWPERRNKFSAEQIKSFRIEQEKEKSRIQATANRSIWAAALGGFNEAEEEEKAEKNLKQIRSKENAVETQEIIEPSKPVESSESSVSSLNPLSSQVSSGFSALSFSSLRFERSRLLEKIDFAVKSFDRALLSLRREKFRLAADLKSADLKLMTLVQELHLLEEFEESEQRLFSKLAKTRAAKSQLTAEMLECERALQLKLGEIRAWQERDRSVLQEFNTVVGGEKSEFYPQLMKIFKKKVKRNKKRQGGKSQAGDGADGGAGDRDSEPESDGNADSEEGGEDSDSENGNSSSSSSSDEDSCPLHCDAAIYEKVLELREKRLEQEEILADFNKSVQELHKAYERHQLRERSIDKELNQTDADIEAFQSEKQRALNLIEVAVPLHLSQLRFLNESRSGLPKDLSQSLVFTGAGLEALEARIGELQNEKLQLTKQLKELKKNHKVLGKELAVRRELIEQEKKKCEDVQRLKFGQTIDLAILDQVGQEDEAQLALDQKLKAIESSSTRKLLDWDDRIDSARSDLQVATRENTHLLNKVAELTECRYQLENELNSDTRRLQHVADSKPLEARLEQERGSMLDLVQLQEREIDALKAEIHVLRRKTGQIFC